MKVKPKLDLASIKSWLLAHGEKVALGVVGVVFLLFTYSALQREVLDDAKQPDKLQQLASSVDQHVRNSNWDPTRDGLQVINYAERTKVRDVKPNDYPLAHPFNPLDTDPKSKRDVPAVLVVEDLRVASGYDLFAEKGAGGDKGANVVAEAQPWAVVTGLIPIARQRQEFDRAFGNALGSDPNRDVPTYYPPVLERTSQVDEKDPKKIKWTRVPAVKPYEDRWSGTAQEIVARRYVDPDLTGKLGSLSNTKQQWGEAVGHPKIPLEGQELKTPGAAAETQTASDDGQDTQDTQDQLFGGSKPAEPKKVEAREESTEPEEVEYLLLRAFDYSVEPGKKYRYRVILGLHNPNFGLPPQQLKDPESARSEFLASEYSEPTAVVTIPDGHRVLAGKVDEGSRFSEPTATLLVTAIDRQAGLEAATEMKEVPRGAVANVKQATVKARVPNGNDVVELTRDFNSNTLVLDIYGGHNLSKRRRTDPITSPGEVLLLDAEGNLIVRSEMDDRAQYESTIVREEVEDKKSTLIEDEPRDRRSR